MSINRQALREKLEARCLARFAAEGIPLTEEGQDVVRSAYLMGFMDAEVFLEVFLVGSSGDTRKEVGK